MKVFLTTGNFAIKTNRQRRKLKAVQYLLESDKNTEKRRFLIKLADILLFPDSYFISLPTPLLASLITQIFNCIEQDTEPFSVHPLELPNDQQQFAVISCPNLMYVVDLIVVLQENRNIPFQMLAHPVLSIKRQGQLITSLEDNGSVGTAQLLILLRLELFDEADKHRFFQHIKKLIAWGLQLDKNRSGILESLNGLTKISALEHFSDLIEWLVQGAFIPFKAWKLTSDAFDAFDSRSIYREFYPDRTVSDYDERTFQREMTAMLMRPTPMIVQYLSIPSPLVHGDRLVYLGFREPRSTGNDFEHGFFGVFDETELNGAAGKLPFLNRKINHILELIRSHSNSYEYLQLKEILNLFPKLDLFLLDDAQSYLIVQSLKRYLFRPEGIKLLILTSPSPDRVSALLIIPVTLYREEMDIVLRDRLCSELNCSTERMQKTVLGGRYNGLHLILIPADDEVSVDVDCLDRDLNRLARPWLVSLRRLMERAYGKLEGGRLWQNYRYAFPLGYQATMPPRYAMKDIRMIEQLPASSGLTINLLSPCHRFKLYRLHFFSLQERYLDEYIPILENLNLRVMDQVQFPLKDNGNTVFVRSFSISTLKAQSESFSKLKGRLLECIRVVLEGKSENDPLNSLLVLTGLSWQQIDVLRAYRNYYLQLGYHTTGTSFNNALINNPKVARSLFEYFDARFKPDPDWADPVVREEQALFPLRLELLEHMATVNDINEDKILRTLFNLIDATMRTNFHVRKDLDDYFIAFKINSLGIIEMPPPKPQYEIYVHAFSMEGIHLRGGKISRGGIRWSDRPDDFRTEILGLMQTQMSKNALIIPKGAKGGFVVKHVSPGSNIKDSGKKAYVTLMQGMLDLTDNYVDDKVVRLPGIVSYDDHDPYLVVAADKGTAQFSDLANSVAERYRFWLNDAFASGGSTGYNHKALGITARGAWECVKRHFREIGKDIQHEPFTVLGIGSMDGDVFGNGMLLSRCIRLLAAFSGQHIFIDPDPTDPERSFQERKRLFELPGSSWDDYDRRLISEGGGVYPRNAKDIHVSPELRKWLGIRYKTLDGATLIRYLLGAPVELLWLGGIGTYVKASSEKNEEVGDRSNDEVRIDAAQLRARVVGEGANLGFTQKARIEYALAGGRINTDAIDNSAGVDTSDHEVNLKILLTDLKRKLLLDDYQRVFTEMTQEVCESVLANNYRQSLCLSLEKLRCGTTVETFLQLAERLENAGVLDRAVESFPGAKEVTARGEQKITRPELAVLMAAAKIELTQEIMDHADVISGQDYDRYLESYFPKPIRRDYQQHLAGHPLAQAIKATVISNKIINQAGCSFLGSDSENEGVIDSVTCYLTFDQVLQGDRIRQAIYALDNQVNAHVQHQLLMELENILADFCQWALLRGETIRPDQATRDGYCRCLEVCQAGFDALEGDQAAKIADKIAGYQDKAVPVELARRVVFISTLVDFPMIVALTAEVGRDFNSVQRVFDEVRTYLELDKVFRLLDQMPLHDVWERKVFIELQADLKQALSHLTLGVLASDSQNCQAYFALPAIKQKTSRYQRLLREICSTLPSGLLPYLTLSKILETIATVR